MRVGGACAPHGVARSYDPCVRAEGGGAPAIASTIAHAPATRQRLC